MKNGVTFDYSRIVRVSRFDQPGDAFIPVFTRFGGFGWITRRFARWWFWITKKTIIFSKMPTLPHFIKNDEKTLLSSKGVTEMTVLR